MATPVMMRAVAVAKPATAPVARVQRPALRRLAMPAVVRPSSRRAARFVVAAAPQKVEELADKVEKAVGDAQETCESGTTEECATAWDEVEELSAELKHKKDRLKEGSDPLDAFCAEAPEADECRVYED